MGAFPPASVGVAVEASQISVGVVVEPCHRAEVVEALEDLRVEVVVVAASVPLDGPVLEVDL